MIEDAFWTRYALPAAGIQDDPHWRKSLARERKWTPVTASFYDKIPWKKYSFSHPGQSSRSPISGNGKGCFLPDEVKGPFNKPVSEDTLSKIIGWLSAM